jgi:hypothetical protein
MVSHPDSDLTRAVPDARVATGKPVASWRVRCSRSADQVSAWFTMASGRTIASPRVKAPPRGSVIGSQMPAAAAPAAATTPPRSWTAQMLRHTGVSFMTERRCNGESPTR